MGIYDLAAEFEQETNDRHQPKPSDDRYQPRKSEHPREETSLAAYDVIKPKQMSLRQAVCDYVTGHPNCTQEDAHEYFLAHGFEAGNLNARYANASLGYATVRSRFSELCASGFIKESDAERPVVNGTVRKVYISTGKPGPILFNRKMTYKEKFVCLFDFLSKEHNDTKDTGLKERIRDTLAEVGFDDS